ncbi:MAG: PDZ domain-containing protein [Bdellovibrionaceae bacterium]|nr:PDZ domain-containing protein [Bdellovibrio sp.]
MKIFLSIIFLGMTTFAKTSTSQPDGFKIIDVEKGSIYEQLGLKPGDVIKSVNGKPVNSVQDSMQFYNTLKAPPKGGASKLEVEVVRNKKVEKFKYDLK